MEVPKLRFFKRPAGSSRETSKQAWARCVSEFDHALCGLPQSGTWEPLQGLNSMPDNIGGKGVRGPRYTVSVLSSAKGNDIDSSSAH